MKATKRFRVYATEACGSVRHFKSLNTGWHDTKEAAIAEHHELCHEHNDQGYLEAFYKECDCVNRDGAKWECEHDWVINKDFISGDYELEAESLYFCDCGEEIDECEEECYDCQEKKKQGAKI